MPQSARFWDRIASMYSKKPVDNEDAYEKKLQVTREYLRPESIVLEFACGTGTTAIKHAPHVKQINAIDISPKMLEIARGKAEAQSVKNVEFTCTTIEEYEASTSSYDVVMAHSILHLVDELEPVFEKVYRLLKPGGVFISSTPCLSEVAPYIKYIAPIGRLLGLMPMIKSFTLSELVGSLAGAGFGIDYQWQPSKNESVFIVASKPSR